MTATKLGAKTAKAQVAASMVIREGAYGKIGSKVDKRPPKVIANSMIGFHEIELQTKCEEEEKRKYESNHSRQFIYGAGVAEK